MATKVTDHSRRDLPRYSVFPRRSRSPPFVSALYEVLRAPDRQPAAARLLDAAPVELIEVQRACDLLLGSDAQ